MEPGAAYLVEDGACRPAAPMRFVPRTVLAAARLPGVQALVLVAAALVGAAVWLVGDGPARACLFAALGGVGIAVLAAVYLQPAAATDLCEWYEPRVVWRFRRCACAALTIDDVPCGAGSRLAEILDVLRDNGARATLFVMSGTATRATADLLRAAVDEGLVELGNHGAYDAVTKTTLSEARLEYFQSARARSIRGLFGSFLDR